MRGPLAMTALISAQKLLTQQLLLQEDLVVVDCRYALTDPEAGRGQYALGHVTGAHYLDLERDLSGEAGRHGGRHPLPQPQDFALTLAALGIDQQTRVVAYDDSRLAFAARLWWLMRSLEQAPVW
jgi:thiosulfate/3-mercaptopyruvate sulfurtransferase